jgi:phosphatidylserine/phosphatidylglycerophosphate/cardiolipin synthase-like enzyme
LLCLLISFAWGDELLIEPDQGIKPILEAINQARYSVDLVMYGFTDQSLADAIIQQKLSGKTVKVILEKTPYKNEEENKKIIEDFVNSHVDWKGTVGSFRLVHQKTLIIDDQKALVMTFNFTHSTFKSQRNFALIIDDPRLVNGIKSVFSADWNDKPVSPQIPELIYSPDNSREKIISAILNAKQTLKIYAENLSDYHLIGAIARASKKGVLVQVVMSMPLRAKQARYLEKAKVSVYYSKKLFIHAKVFIIDNETAIIGSINLTRSSLEDNRELSIVSKDKEVIKKLTETFNQDISGPNLQSLNHF